MAAGAHRADGSCPNCIIVAVLLSKALPAARGAPANMLVSCHAEHGGPAPRRSRDAEGDADRRAAARRAAGRDHQGDAAPSLRSSRRDAPRGSTAARAGGCGAGRRVGRDSGGSTKPGGTRRGLGQAASQPWCVAVPSAAHRDRLRPRRQELPGLPRPASSDRGGSLGAARHRPGPVPRPGHAPAPLCLPGLRGRRRPEAGTGTAHRGRPADRDGDRVRPRRQIRRSPAAVPPVADLRAAGHQTGPLHAGRLGRAGGLPSSAHPRAPSRDPAGLSEALRRRDHRAGARPGPRAHQDRAVLGLRP